MVTKVGNFLKVVNFIHFLHYFCSPKRDESKKIHTQAVCNGSNRCFACVYIHSWF